MKLLVIALTASQAVLGLVLLRILRKMLRAMEVWAEIWGGE